MFCCSLLLRVRDREPGVVFFATFIAASLSSRLVPLDARFPSFGYCELLLKDALDVALHHLRINDQKGEMISTVVLRVREREPLLVACHIYNGLVVHACRAFGYALPFACVL